MCVRGRAAEDGGGGGWGDGAPGGAGVRGQRATLAQESSVQCSKRAESTVHEPGALSDAMSDGRMC